MPSEKNWYAIYTRPRWEKKVAASLSTKQIINYCPVNSVIKQWSDRKKLVEEPLFTSYVFVRVDQGEMLKVIQTDGVLNFVRWLKKPAIIKNEEIELIREYLAEYQYVRVEAVKVGMNDVVKITDGPLREMEGNILFVGKTRVKIYLQSLGYIMIAEVDKSKVQVVKKSLLPQSKAS